MATLHSKGGDKCIVCSNKATKAEVTVACGICEKIAHAACVNIDAEVCDKMKAQANWHWYCDVCNGKVIGLINEMAKLDAKVEAVSKELEEVREHVDMNSRQIKDEITHLWVEIDSVKAQLSKANENDESINRQVQELTTALINDGPWSEAIKKEVDSGLKSVREDVEEQIEIDRRRNNLMLFGVAEMDAGEDSEVVKQLFSTLKLDYARHVESLVRIGKFSTEKSRPIKLRIKSFEGKKEILIRAKLLRELEGYKGVFIAPDLTRKQQALDKDLRMNLKTIKEAGQKQAFIKAGKIVTKNEAGGIVVLYPLAPQIVLEDSQDLE